MHDCPTLLQPSTPLPSDATPPMVSIASAPFVSIHVPICEPSPSRIHLLLAKLALLDYPAFEVLVVDYGTADPELWEAVARGCARLGPRFRFFHLGRWPGGHAGALNFARMHTASRAEFIAPLDAGIVVPRDWLDRAMPEFMDPCIGAIRSPCIVRTQTLDAIGGWAEWCVDAAAALDLALLRTRWRVAPPSEWTDHDTAELSARRQTVAKQAYGAAQIACRYWRVLASPFNHELSLRQRWCVVAGWFPWVADALSLSAVLSSVALSVGFIVMPSRSTVPMIVCALPSAALLMFWLRRSRRTGPGAAIVGLALSHAAGRAVWSALLNKAPPCLHGGAVRQELALLLLSWAALAGVAHAGPATWQATLWCAMLLLESLPYLAAVSVAAFAATPAWQPTLTETQRGPVARTRAGD